MRWQRGQDHRATWTTPGQRTSTPTLAMQIGKTDVPLKNVPSLSIITEELIGMCSFGVDGFSSFGSCEDVAGRPLVLYLAQCIEPLLVRHLLQLCFSVEETAWIVSLKDFTSLFAVPNMVDIQGASLFPRLS